jgi:hypothetical protein
VIDHTNPPSSGTLGETSSSLRVWVALEGKNHGHIQQLEIDPHSGDVWLTGPPLLLPGLSLVRGLARAGEELIVGDGGSPRVLVVDLATSTVLRQLDTPGLPNVHALCALPDGNLVAGAYGGGSGNPVVELHPDAPGLTFVRRVYETTISNGTLSHCAALSDDTLFLADYEAKTDADGDVVLLSRSPSEGQWLAQQRSSICRPSTS